MERIVRAWKGGERLWIVFWLYNVLLGSVLTAWSDVVAGSTHLVMLVTAIIVTLVWAVWVTVALWRGAINAGWRGWGYLVRGMLVIAGVLLIVSFLIPANATLEQ